MAINTTVTSTEILVYSDQRLVTRNGVETRLVQLLGLVPRLITRPARVNGVNWVFIIRNGNKRSPLSHGIR